MIYLDHAATWPALPEVVDAMVPWIRAPANPASAHAAGRAAAAALDAARVEVAALLGRDPDGVVFTSGATEANHTALRGLAARGLRHVAVCGLEHPSVHGGIAAAGLEVVPVPVGASGVAEVDAVSGLSWEVVAVMAVNHELGTVQPVARARAIAAERGAWLHVDAAQAFGKVRVDGLADADSVTVSAHKIGGPVGVGALSLRSGAPFPALLPGGAHERGRRAGTVDVAGAVGFAAACRVARRDGAARDAAWRALAEVLRAGVCAIGARPVGSWDAAVASTTAFVLPGVRGDTLVHALDLEGIAVSSGAACASGSLAPSPVLGAMGDPEPAGIVRVSLGPATSRADVDTFLATLAALAPRVRAAAALEADGLAPESGSTGFR